MHLRFSLSRPALLIAEIITFAVSAIGAQPLEISFTPRTLKETNAEGPDVERTYFTIGDKRIVIGPPKECRLKVEDGKLVATLSEAGLDGEIQISRSPFTPELDLAGNALQYRDAAVGSVPKGATQIVAQPPVMDPYPFNGWKSLGFTSTYSVYARPMTRTVSYVNLEVGVQLVVTTLAATKDTERVEKIARQFMSSWWVKDE